MVAAAALAVLRCARDDEPVPGGPSAPTNEDASATPAPIGDGATEPTEDAPPLLPARRTLFVGNSFVYFNDLPATFRGLATTSEPLRAPPIVETVAYGAYTLTAHLADANGTGANPRLATLFGLADASAPAAWDHVVLQEQSQIPGFDATDPAREKSIASAVSLAAHAKASGATSVLFMTWGYRNGDPQNGFIYPDYLAMQARLEAGYRDMAKAIANAGSPVKIAPVGLAFKAIYEREVALGHDPLAAGSPFAQLYAPDALHPGAPGSYLGACVVIATIHDVDPTTFTADVPEIDSATETLLRTAARDVVAAEKAR
jgi:hypothetical protein